MSDGSTTRILEAYEEQRVSAPMFLTSFFRLVPGNIHSSEFVEVDIRRGEPRIAVAVQDLQAGARKIANSGYQNKKFAPAIFKLEGTVDAWTASKRQLGMQAFEDPDFRRAAMASVFRNMNDAEEMIGRGVEFMAGQTLQTGAISLKDNSGATMYTLDFQPRASLFVTVGTAWAADGSAGDPMSDLEGLCRDIRRHGKQRPTDAIFGSGARARFMKNAKVLAQFNNLGLQRLQDIAPDNVPQDATYFGTIVIGNYRIRCWEYDADYIDPATEEVTPYIDTLNVVVVARAGRRDLTFGAIPMFTPPEARAAQFMPPRLTSVAGGFDLTTNIWLAPDGQSLNVSVGTRPLTVPTALDTFGCLTVGS